MGIDSSTSVHPMEFDVSQKILWSSPIVVSPTVMVPVVGTVLLSRPIFFFSYFCRCVSALAVSIVVTSGEVGLKEGYGGGLVIVTLKPTVV